MKSLYIIVLSAICMIAFCHVGTAQKTDYNRVVLPEGAGNVEFAERLVQLAWRNHPGNKIVQKEVVATEYEQKRTKAQWLDIVDIQGNVNEFVINPDRDELGRASLFPRYNIRATIPLGIFTRVSAEVKQDQLQTAMAQERVNAKKLEVRRLVLEQYNNYLMFQEIYNIRTLALQDAESSHQVMEESFKQGEETFDKYVASLNNFNRSKIEKIQSQTDFLNAKLALEEMIGVPLEEVN